MPGEQQSEHCEKVHDFQVDFRKGGLTIPPLYVVDEEASRRDEPGGNQPRRSLGGMNDGRVWGLEGDGPPDGSFANRV